MVLRFALLGTAMAVALGGAAHAAHVDGWYLGLEGGAAWIEDWSHARVGAPLPGAASADFEAGWTVIATVGYAFAGNWRAEFEGGYRDNDIDTYTGLGVLQAITGDVWEASFLINLLYDIYLSDHFSFSLGAGAGGDFAELTLVPAAAPSMTDDDWNFAYQGLAGVNYALGRRTYLTLNYRYFRAHEPDFDFRPVPNLVLNANDDFVKHTVTVGLRYALQAPQAYAETPQPPPAPEPATAPPQQFIVFFGFNKYNLTSEAVRVISEAVVAARQTGSATVLITGHTDTVGSHRYNERLSMRRSNTVKAEMVRQGIPTSAITAMGKGETELLVQTADGVKEPQNRRATIDLN